MNEQTETTERGPHAVTLAQWICCAPFEKLLGMTIHSAVDGKAVLSMPFLYDLANGAGLMHGGALISLADTAVAMAIKSIVEPGTHFATISLENRFLSPVREGVVTARASVTAGENRILKGEASVYDEEGIEIIRFSSVFKIARKTNSVTIGLASGQGPTSAEKKS